MTPTLARMVPPHERNYKKPIKWFAIPQLFRYERQQKGRLREHFQLNADIIGDRRGRGRGTHRAAHRHVALLRADPEDFVIRLSSRNAVAGFFQPTLRGSDQGLRVLPDHRQAGAREAAESQAKLRALGFSLDEITRLHQNRPTHAELDAVLKNLAARGMGDFVKVDYQVIRGLAYYTGVVFEAFDQQGEFRAIAGGGRYNDLSSSSVAARSIWRPSGSAWATVVLLELLKTAGCCQIRRGVGRVLPD